MRVIMMTNEYEIMMVNNPTKDTDNHDNNDKKMILIMMIILMVMMIYINVNNNYIFNDGN